MDLINIKAEQYPNWCNTVEIKRRLGAGNMASDWVDAARVGDIPNNECMLFDLDDEYIAIYNLDGEYFAIEDRCTHDGGDLAGGWVEGGCAVCPRHGARFDIRTGKVMAPPAYEDIHAFPVRIQQDMIQIRDDRE